MQIMPKLFNSLSFTFVSSVSHLDGVLHTVSWSLVLLDIGKLNKVIDNIHVEVTSN